MLDEDIKRFLAAGGFQDVITRLFQKTPADPAHAIVIFHQKNDFMTAGQPGTDAGSGRLGYAGLEGGQENLKNGAGAGIAGYFDPALMLFDNAKDGGQAQPGAFANLLGREKRLENPREMFGRNTRARVHYAEANETAGAPFGMGLDSRSVEFDPPRGDTELPAGGHGVTRVDHQIHDHL